MRQLSVERNSLKNLKDSECVCLLLPSPNDLRNSYLFSDKAYAQFEPYFRVLCKSWQSAKFPGFSDRFRWLLLLLH